MSEQLEPGQQKSSGLKTFLWAAAAVVAVFVLPHAIFGSALLGLAVKGAALLYTGSHAWKSHKENKAIDAENAAIARSGNSPAYAQQLAQEQEVGTRWQDAERSRGAAYQGR